MIEKGGVKLSDLKAHLFFLKQFGFRDTLLETIYLMNLNPVRAIFDNNYIEAYDIKQTFTKKEKKLSKDSSLYFKMIEDMMRTEEFLEKNSNNKIYFKYEENSVSKLFKKEVMSLFIYGKGNQNLLEKTKYVSVIGTRKPSKEYIELGKKVIMWYIIRDYVVVSGLAEGIDTLAHELTIKNHGSTIAILPTNFTNIYPKKNLKLSKKIEQYGLLISEVGPREKTYKSSFLDRNRYVANICDVLLVIQTDLKSGTMNTIRQASEMNKNIIFIEQNCEEVNQKILEYGGKMIGKSDISI